MEVCHSFFKILRLSWRQRWRQGRDAGLLSACSAFSTPALEEPPKGGRMNQIDQWQQRGECPIQAGKQAVGSTEERTTSGERNCQRRGERRESGLSFFLATQQLSPSPLLKTLPCFLPLWRHNPPLITYTGNATPFPGFP